MFLLIEIPIPELPIVGQHRYWFQQSVLAAASAMNCEHTMGWLKMRARIPPRRLDDSTSQLAADRVALGDCPPRAPTDPYVPALEHTVPQIMDSLRA